MVHYEQVGDFIHYIEVPSDKVHSTSYSLHFTGGGASTETVSGATHVYEHCVAEEVSGMTRSQFNNWQARSKVNFGAWTSLDHLWFDFTGHKSYSSQMKEAIMRIAFDPVLNEENLLQERRIVANEMREKMRSFGYISNRMVSKRLYTPDSGALSKSGGEPSSIEHLTLDDLEERKNQVYKHSHVVFCAAGANIDRSSIKQDLMFASNILGSTDRKPVNSKIETYYKKFDYIGAIGLNSLINTNLTLNIPVNEVSYDNEFTRITVGDLLCGFPNGAILRKLRHEAGIVYGLGSSWDTSDKLFQVKTSTALNNRDSVINVVRNMKNYENQVLNIDEIEHLKKAAVNGMEMQSDSPYQQMSIVRESLLDVGIPETPDQRIEKVNSVTLSEVSKLFSLLVDNIDKMSVIAISTNPLVLLKPRSMN